METGIFGRKTKVDEALAVSKQISRLTYILGYRLQSAKSASDRIILSSALTILTQAQVLAQTSATEASRLYNLAYKVGAMVKAARDEEA